SSESMPVPKPGTDRDTALEAGVRLAQTLTRYGPVILVLDDVHWADQDSLNTLDALQSSVSDSFGIITASRAPDDDQRVPADHVMELEPVDDRVAIQWLTSVADRWRLSIPLASMERWVEICRGCPLDLQMVADEIRPGGVLANASEEPSFTSHLGRVQLWRRQIDRLSFDAQRALDFLAVARRQVSYRELGAVTGCDDQIDVVISELAHGRLVLDDAIGGIASTDEAVLGDVPCVRVFHASISEAVVATMEGSRKRSVHRRWAEYLIANATDTGTAGRIAGHLFDAEEQDRAVPFALQAADEAEVRRAMTEAAKWRQRTLSQLYGPELENQLRQTTRCFAEADLPLEASRFQWRLAQLVGDADEKIELELAAISGLIRSGRLRNFRSQVRELGSRLRIPMPKSAWRTKLSLAWMMARLCWSGNPFRDPPPMGIEYDPSDLSARRDRQSLHVCLELARPLSMFDNAYAAELNVAGAVAVRKRGTEAEVLLSTIGACVFGAYLPGRRRRSTTKLLASLRPRVEALRDDKLMGDYHCGVAFQLFFQCRWRDSMGPLLQALEGYSKASRPCGFEIFHARWMGLWNSLKLGDIRRLVSEAEEMHAIANMRGDRFAWLVTTGGLGSAAWLATDDTGSLFEFHRETVRSMKELGPQWLDVFQMLADVQLATYEGSWGRVIQLTDCEESPHVRPMFKQFQFLDVLRLESHLRGLLGLMEHQVNAAASDDAAFLASDSGVEKRHHGDSSKSVRIINWRSLQKDARQALRRMRARNLHYANMLAEYFDGRLALLNGGTDVATERFRIAETLAESADLLPWQLACRDWAQKLQIGVMGDELNGHLHRQGVRRPDKFRRLYL
ncbi:MAG: hypothetical protein AAF989_08505, partial [Planctomycetota bacterium]